MVQRLHDAGYPADRVEAISYDRSVSNVDIAQQIHHAVDDLRVRTGARRVDIVSHSMGAISSRYYLERLGGTSAVDAWVSLAGVNEGTIWAYACFVLTQCREMVPSSSLLDDLNRTFPPAGATRYATWWSPCDTTVVPSRERRARGRGEQRDEVHRPLRAQDRRHGVHPSAALPASDSTRPSGLEHDLDRS